MSEKDETVEAVARAICAEKCAYMGEPACWSFTEESFPPATCDEPGCMSEARAALSSAPLRAATRMREALEKIANGEEEEYDEELRAPVIVPMDAERLSELARAALTEEPGHG